MRSRRAGQRRSTLGRASLASVLLLASSPAGAQTADYFFQLDGASVVGNASGGAGCSSGFAGGFEGWFAVNGSPAASGGFIEFEDPGAASGAFLPFYDVLVDREDIIAPAACELSFGGGNATLTTEWVNALPGLPGDYYGHQLVSTLSATSVEAIIVTLDQLDATLAAEFGLSPGLQVIQSKLLLDATDPNDVFLVSPAQLQSVSITEAQLAGATGSRIYLRLSYDETAGTVEASYSLDGEASYQTPFTPVFTDFTGFVPARLWATGAAATPSVIVPSVSPVGGLLVGALLAVTSLWALRGSGRRPLG